MKHSHYSSRLFGLISLSLLFLTRNRIIKDNHSGKWVRWKRWRIWLICLWAIILWQVIWEKNDSYCLITAMYVNAKIYKQASQIWVFHLDVLDVIIIIKKKKDLNDFGKGQLIKRLRTFLKWYNFEVLILNYGEYLLAVIQGWKKITSHQQIIGSLSM